MDDDGLVSLSFGKGPLGFTLSKQDGCTVTSVYPPGHALNGNSGPTEKLKPGFELVRIGGKRVVRDKGLIAAQLKAAPRPVVLTWRPADEESLSHAAEDSVVAASHHAAQQSETEESDEPDMWGEVAPLPETPRAAQEEGIPPKPQPQPQPALLAEVLELVSRLQPQRLSELRDQLRREESELRDQLFKKELLRLGLVRDELLRAAPAGTDAQCTVYVGGLSVYTDDRFISQYEAELGLLFGEFGTVNAVQVQIELGAGKESWALVSFGSASEAQAASASAAKRLSQREQHRTHRLQGLTKLGED